MKYIIRNITILHEGGKRDYNEDSLFPSSSEISTDDRLFMVCDGVGGSAKGEEASKLVCQHFSGYVQRQGTVYEDKKLLTEAIRYAEMKMDRFVADHPECAGMATTLTYLHLTEFGASIAWAGDSRVYQIRKNAILYRTDDHSLVNALLKHGEITEEEAKVHPKRNVILRAVTGTKSPTQLSVFLSDDVAAGDCFLLCSDGILEAVSDEKLLQLLAGNHSLENVRDAINDLCRQNSNDNYTMILLQIEDVMVEDLTGNKTAVLSKGSTLTENRPVHTQKEQPTRRFSKMLSGVAVFVVIWLGWMLFNFAFSNPLPEGIKSVTITPKTFGNELHLNIKADQEMQVVFELKDQKDSVFLREKTQLKVDFDKTFDMKKIPVGVYLLTLETNNGVWSEKVVKK